MEMEGHRCFIRSTVRLVHVEKWTLLMYWSKVLRTGLNSVTWYHCDISGLVISDSLFSATGCCWLGRWSGLLVRLTCHMPDVFDRVHYHTVRPYFTTLSLG